MFCRKGHSDKILSPEIGRGKLFHKAVAVAGLFRDIGTVIASEHRNWFVRRNDCSSEVCRWAGTCIEQSKILVVSQLVGLPLIQHYRVRNMCESRAKWMSG